MEFYEKGNVFINIIRGVIISFLFTALSLLIYSFVLVYTDISENTIEVVITVITGISILIGSSIGNIKSNKNGILNGALIGGIYIILLYLISSVVGSKFNLNLQSIILI